MLAKIKELSENSVYTTMKSPVGELVLIAQDRGLCALYWDSESSREQRQFVSAYFKKQKDHPHLKITCQQLKEYFGGQRRSFDIPLVVEGTQFQKKAWKALVDIPYGTTISYQDQAKVLGNINKVRAVGGANGKNAIPIIIPCHRVIAKNGNLGGFTGGLEIKKYLLSLEASNSH